MSTEVNIVFTGICLLLTDKNRVIIGQTPQKAPCLTTSGFTIPMHYPYVTYARGQRTSGQTTMKTGTFEDAIRLSGLVTITGNIIETTLPLTPGSPLPNIVKPKEIAPAYTPLPTALQDDPAQIDPTKIAARIDLPFSTLLPIVPSEGYWHFFPVKNKSIRMQIAQAITVRLHVSDDKITLTQTPFGGGGGGATEVVTLKSTTGEPINLRVGNSSEPDIVPANPTSKPPVGPDYDFELHWNIFDRNGDTECPPVSFNEGVWKNGGFVTLGGGNCPPTQWP